MKVQINSDKQVTVGTELMNNVKAEVERAFERFSNQITRVEVHLSDLNSSKRGVKDKRCMLEVRPAGKRPVSVDDRGATVQQAVKGAAGKMKRLLQSSLGRAAHQTSRASLYAGKRALRSSTGTLAKLGRIQATLAELFDHSGEESPQFERHVRAATDALQKARLLVETNQERASGPRPAKAPAAKRARVSPQKASATAEKVPANGRSPKRKGVYQARRKSWPKR
ncbi:MAG: HPF/RaiA family ribosome-associated protein [Acidobacteriaceae bacterium]|nr:HPF/RaiA family ribosome-associated protein [Acidobacteriaceae bacterium]MBV9037410.1 HPF/RaiA family ribosome-associated protein [Acidobacteriaceae bacterium]MBV9677367.1 HPF/RaiA family ribosome-associated protein [Acidobacteriaceae bacterium]MBV9938886.1 HPF/RaiA family ribosome-associated protein [Acidobacteriaceae bacterium]